MKLFNMKGLRNERCDIEEMFLPGIDSRTKSFRGMRMLHYIKGMQRHLVFPMLFVFTLGLMMVICSMSGLMRTRDRSIISTNLVAIPINTPKHVVVPLKRMQSVREAYMSEGLLMFDASEAQFHIENDIHVDVTDNRSAHGFIKGMNGRPDDANKKSVEGRGALSIMLHDFENLQYYGDVYVGGEGPYRMGFDTGSAECWVPSSRCDDVACGFHRLYNHDESATYREDGRPFAVAYGSGNVSGFLSVDKLMIGDIEMENYTFGEVVDVSQFGMGYKVARMDGLFGLAFRAIATDGVTPPFMEMANRGLVHKPVFSFYLGRRNGMDGELVLGGYDDNHFTGEVKWVNIVQPAFWEVPLESASIGGNRLSVATSVIIDSGTSLIVGPYDDVMKVVELVGAYQFPYTSQYFVSCSKMHTMPPIVFVIDNREFSIPANHYIMKLNEDPKMPCILGFMPDGDIPWILGDIFMRQYYTIFDYGLQRIGFADLVDDDS